MKRKGIDLAEKKLAKDSNVAWLNSDHPYATKHGGAGFYEVVEDQQHDVSESDSGDRVVAISGQVKYGKQLHWHKDTPDPEGEPMNHENNEGHFVYSGAAGEEN